MVNGYYNGVTKLYEYGWGQGSPAWVVIRPGILSLWHSNLVSFLRSIADKSNLGLAGKPFAQGLARNEHYLAAKIGIKCANIVGINNNLFQIDRARKYVAKVGLADKVTFEQADFTQMSSKFGENTFDAVFSIEATCRAPVAKSVYGEVFKVLKPGCIFGFYEWCLTDKYNDDDSFHRRIRREIELGDARPELRTIERAAEALRAVGFEIIESDDLATPDDLVPWA
ncbi:hypothetical protein O181_042989 [Austropuccinia psidii MF-1]|uniref:SAM-dependent methyltransferase Erg6/SMT-type domain-containing protein n=1 Tax=Austropuccinia psidii MF-1 TaxID=1389203 RepID=A0A9Q3HI00_9BASI|nr:hypothetical protein [Austropuccinia psidii MF-1]